MVIIIDNVKQLLILAKIFTIITRCELGRFSRGGSRVIVLCVPSALFYKNSYFH